ncbi:hypothetical protein [Stenotrophobium rhamnosiphilum]|uniref:SMP-30/Gluconolactonase/LRE-like region domain-containing protein n=1 Tax=Stenotrophobium rhamnosiphilum TaxID=2029166 RepID=A0A2T5MK23_9GAMM|nr:hypothetical protein [Stenotrophobium rhamnosiphilum]PTU32937.1 hypothetical protein CJD38_02155 [Stenotrophobium rhamnosiphilum]
MRTLPLILATTLLAGCISGGDPDPQTTAVDPATLCVASACGVKTQLLDIPSAENTLFTPTGRLFVSGSDSVYEVTKDSSGWHATSLATTKANFTGLAQRGNVIYAAAFDGNLYAARLNDNPPAFKAIHALGMSSANGMTAGPDGELYIVNGPLGASIPAPKIIRLRFGSDPMKVTEQIDWLTSNLYFPNGLQRRGNTLVVSDSDVLNVAIGAVKSIEIKADGSAGVPQLIGSFPSLPDEIGLVGDSVLAAFYSNGQIGLIDASGTLVSQTDLLSFENPSSVKLGQPPMFERGDLLVTEKGLIIIPPIPGYGSKLSVFQRKP